MPYEHDAFPDDDSSKLYLANKPILNNIDLELNGKIVAECKCDLVERIFADLIVWDYGTYYELKTRSYSGDDLSTCACLEYEDLPF